MNESAAPVSLESPEPYVALVTLRRPEARNAVNGAVAQALDRIVKATEADDDVRVVVLTGAGGQAFCAGADLKEVSQGRLNDLMTHDGGFGGFVRAKRDKPWIAAVDGFALAGGCEIALACDMIVASDDAAFGLPEVTRGLIAAAGGLFRLPRALPRALALELIATGGRLPAASALAFGLVNRVCPKARTLPEAIALAAAISGNAPIAVRESLAVARRAYDLDDETLARLSDEAQARVMLTADFREGPVAFIEKRAPRWLGR
ncbi:MAG: enoyl-CoA hydratase-related protein [Gammaproteobacteria bacterium]|nr:enoyl-CoA hydratase-related protein [Gammaproteobacteria bacterium]